MFFNNGTAPTAVYTYLHTLYLRDARPFSRHALGDPAVGGAVHLGDRAARTGEHHLATEAAHRDAGLLAHEERTQIDAAKREFRRDVGRILASIQNQCPGDGALGHAAFDRIEAEPSVVQPIGRAHV